MELSNRDKVLQSCASTSDALQSIVEKVKLFPLPIRLASPMHAQKTASSSSVSDTVRQVVVLGMTILYYEEAVEASQPTLSKKHIEAVKAITSSIETLRVLTNKSLSRLLMLAGRQPTLPEDYAKQFSKVITKLEKQAAQCVTKMNNIVAMEHLPSMTRTMHHIKSLPSSQGDLRPEDLELSELFSVLNEYTIRLARTNAEKALIGEMSAFKQNCNAASSTDAAATLKLVMERRNAPIEELLTSTRKMNELKINKAEEHGFISRIKATRREPNWKTLQETTSCPSLTTRVSSMTAESRSSSSHRRGEKNWPLEECSAVSEPQPLLNVDDSRQSGTTASPFDLDDVYDSYHDHDIDATLGLPGSNAIHALTRQPSHKSRSGQTVNIRTKAFPMPPSLPARSRVKLSTDVVEVSTKQVMPGSNVQSDSKSPKVVVKASTTGTTIPAIQDIRDQYY